MTRRRKYKRYSPEFKREALRRVSEDGVTDKLVCEELGISPRQLRRWRDQFRLHGDEAFIGQGRSRDDEVTRLKRELQQVIRTRGLHRQARQKVPYPVIALVGYTNSGKSTLFNHLTQETVRAQDMLFLQTRLNRIERKCR